MLYERVENMTLNGLKNADMVIGNRERFYDKFTSFCLIFIKSYISIAKRRLKWTAEHLNV